MVENPRHFQKIHGWFTFPQLYHTACHYEYSSDPATIVEVGTWMGKSICYLAETIKIAGLSEKRKVFAVDTWEGSIFEPKHQKIINDYGGDLFSVFQNNMIEAGVEDIVTPLRMTSVEASKTFEDKSVDFVFIDAGHTYEEVVEDIKSWLPKVKKGGFIGGHDYYREPPGKDQEGVHKGVHEFFTHEEIESNENCWVYHPVK